MFSFKVKKNHSYKELRLIINKIVPIYWKTKKCGEAKIHILFGTDKHLSEDSLLKEMELHSQNLKHLAGKFSEEINNNGKYSPRNILFGGKDIKPNDFSGVIYVESIEMYHSHLGKGVTKDFIECLVKDFKMFGIKAIILKPYPTDSEHMGYRTLQKAEEKLIKHFESFGFEKMFDGSGEYIKFIN